MSWWGAKYKNGHGEYEITFASKDYEKTKAVEKLCQAIIDQKVKSPDDLPQYISGKDTNVPTNADRIRSMSDEELVRIMRCPRVTGLDSKQVCLSVSCRDCVLKWLKQPAKEDA